MNGLEYLSFMADHYGNFNYEVILLIQKIIDLKFYLSINFYFGIFSPKFLTDLRILFQSYFLNSSFLNYSFINFFFCWQIHSIDLSSAKGSDYVQYLAQFSPSQYDLYFLVNNAGTIGDVNKYTADMNDEVEWKK